MKRYVFKKRSNLVIVGAIDLAGSALRALVSPLFRRRPRQRRPGRILAVRLDHMGDVLFATPALRRLRSAFPGAHISLLVDPANMAVVEGTGMVDSMIPFASPWFSRRPDRPAWRSVARTIRALRRERFDLAIDFRGDIRTIALLWLAGIPERISYGVAGGAFLLTKCPEYRSGRHEVEHNMALVPGGLDGTSGERLERLSYSPAQAEAAGVLLGGRNVGREGPLVGLQISAGFPTKRWPAERFADLAERLGRRGGRTVIVGSEAERPEIEAFAAGIEPAPLLAAGRTNLPTLAAVIDRLDLFIGNDSGPTHIAAAMGRPTLFLWSGTNDVHQWGPWGGVDHVRLIRVPVECEACELRTCPREHECMRGIEVNEVYQAALELLGGNREVGSDHSM